MGTVIPHPGYNNPVYNVKNLVYNVKKNKGAHYTRQNAVYGMENIFQDTI